MGLEDTLTKLDEKIWKQYEKVTNYCNEEYGLNKYDLATRAALGASISFLGTNVYLLIGGFQISSMFSITVGIMGSLVAVPAYYVRKKDYEREEAEEMKLLESNGALQSPISKPYRPLDFGLAAFFFSSAVSSMLGDFPQPNEEQNTLLMCTTLAGCYFVCSPSESYFADQIMTPPKKKKSVFKTIYEKITGKLQPATQPQLEPAKYQSIDDIVGGA